MERHLLNTLVLDVTAEVTCTELAVLTVNHHLTATGNHVTSHVVKEWAVYAACATYNDVVSRVNAVAASSVCSEEIVPAVAIDHCSSLAVDSDVWIYSTLYLCTGLRVELNHADEAEICTICTIETTCLRVHEETCVDSVAVLVID